MTQAEQVSAAVDLGVDAIGMILHADSPRRIELEQALAIRKRVPAFVSLVGVFVNCPAAQIRFIAENVGLDLLQLHGEESRDFAETLCIPYIKAIRAESKDQVDHEVQQFDSARALLLDPYVAGQHGGTGKELSLDLWPSSSHKLILAGGLSAQNVAHAVQAVQPYAVDLNSGIETSPGIKDLSQLGRVLRSIGR
ncbi:MAG: phosphoribosylanthranilate isomerase [Cryomorphaceae bacterium]|jgi:phosphoribosylanthranilate isomerase